MTLIGAAVIEDIDNYYKQLQKDLDEVERKSTRNFVTDAPNSNKLAVKLKKQMKGYEQQIANYKLTVQNDTEVIYKLFVHRNILEVAIQEFLKNTDDKNKELFLNTLNNIKTYRETNHEYKDKWWKWANQQNLTSKLLWDAKNPDKIDYTPLLNFPEFN